MARVANLDKNPRVKTLVSITGDKYKNYKVILTDTFYRKVYRGDAVHCSVKYENHVKALQEQIIKLENRNPEDFALNGEIEIGASTLTDAHEKINSFLTLEGWHQYRAGMISAIQDEIKKEEEKIKVRDREDRERTTYRFDSGWKDVIISGDGDGIFGKEDWEINGMVGRTTKAIASNTKTVSEWKDTELKRLKETLIKLNENIALMESIDVDEVQHWMDALKVNATEYIENGVEHEFN